MGLTADRRLPVVVGLAAGLVMQFSLLWDVSWHMTIGRDTFWSPPHIGLYFGGAVPGIAGGLLVLWISFAAPDSVRAGSSRVAGLYGPLGAWVAIWGSMTMLTAGAFDQWWHSAYGLDLAVLSPPHMALAVGIGAIQLGTWLLIAGGQNRAGDRKAPGLRVLHAIAVGLVLLMMAMVELEHTARTFMHATPFYLLVCGTYPVLLVGARASGLRWPATGAAAVYTGFRLVVTWLLPLFPGSPRLGPIYFTPDHMVPPDFPLLLVVPAVALDWWWNRFGERGHVRQAVIAGALFFGVFIAVQWPFAEFLMTPRAHNWIFAAHNFRYFLSPGSYTAKGVFFPWEQLGGTPRWIGMPAALGVAIGSSSLGLAWRNWLLRIQR